MLIISPGIARLSFAGADQLKPLTAEEIGMLDDDTAFELLQGKAFLTSRMTRTKDDSIGLAIDLKAMTIALEIKGVVLFSRPVEDADISPYFNGLHDSLLLKITSVPLTATSFRSTIVKEPIIEKIAPKDTSEVQLDAYNVDTSYREPAFLIITLDNGMELILKQYHGVSFKDRIKYGSFIFRERANRISSTLKALLRGRTPEYIPYATIELQA
ncbi:MAG TPA: hypothetical protein VK994_04865, partial [Bacteroidales bacterium]|nr:hypothetical protein [Bacteroidales bacterium]